MAKYPPEQQWQLVWVLPQQTGVQAPQRGCHILVGLHFGAPQVPPAQAGHHRGECFGAYPGKLLSTGSAGHIERHNEEWVGSLGGSGGDGGLDE